MKQFRKRGRLDPTDAPGIDIDEKTRARLSASDLESLKADLRDLRTRVSVLLGPIFKEVKIEAKRMMEEPGFLRGPGGKWSRRCTCGERCRAIIVRNDLIAQRFPFWGKRKPREFFGEHRKKAWKRRNRMSRSKAAHAREALKALGRRGGRPSAVLTFHDPAAV